MERILEGNVLIIGFHSCTGWGGKKDPASKKSNIVVSHGITRKAIPTVEFYLMGALQDISQFNALESAHK